MRHNETKARNEEIIYALRSGATTKSVADWFKVGMAQIRFIVRHVTGANLEALRYGKTRGDVTYIGPTTVYERPFTNLPPRERIETDKVAEVPFDGTFTESELRMIERQKQAAYEKEKTA